MNAGEEQLRPCPECGGVRVRAVSTGYIQLRPEGHSILGGKTVRALVCTNCGYPTFYVEGARDWAPKDTAER